MRLKTLLIFGFTLIVGAAGAQDIVWANKLLELTDRFQFENNTADLVLKVPTVYSNNVNEKLDPYTDGYVLYQTNIGKKNIIKVGFPTATTARQVVLGGVFNIGSIYSISITNSDGIEKEIYNQVSKTNAPKFNTMGKNGAKVKFNTFSAFFPETRVIAVKLTFDHAKINEWNLLKGVGLSNSENTIELYPKIIPQEGFSNKQQVGDNISSKDCFEFNPKLSPDGKTLYFVKECPNQSDQDIWVSELNEKGQWTEAKNAGFPLNNKGHNFVASISVDGRFLILGNTYNNDGSDAGDGVSIAHKKEDGTWEVPKPIKIMDYKNTNDNANFFMSSDEKVLLLAIQDETSAGDLDIYASTYNSSNQTWTKPVNLGKMINTPFAEDYPYLAPDGVTLYFSSKGYLGYGGHDIYMSKRLDNSWTKWTKPVNLGPLVNSKTDDKGFTIAMRGDQAYFNSLKFENDTSHHMDIYKVNLPKILRQNPQVLVAGEVKNATNNEKVRGTVRVKNKEGDLIAFCVSNPKSGKYIFSIPFGQQYTVRVDAINYFKYEDKLNLSDTLTGIELTRDFVLSPFLDSGQTIVINNILFEKGSSKLPETSFSILDDLAQKLQQQPEAMVEIGGHTDNQGEAPASAPKGGKKGQVKKTAPAKNQPGTFTDNKTLSLERAQAVGQYLISKGISGNRLSYKGYGAEQPVADNNTPEGRAKNRRVVITYLSKIISQND